MLQPVLGTGIIYRKKRNMEITQKRCESCGGNIDLQSYDINKYIGLLGLPVIPLGKRRIVDKCTSCGHYYVNYNNNLADFQKAYTVIVIYLVLFIYFFSSYMIGKSREVYLVNGLNRYYEVEINGEKEELLPLSHKKIKIVEGDITIKADELLLTPLTITIRTPFYSRLFSKKNLVINPDGTAVFLWEKATYATEIWSKMVGQAKTNVGSNYISSTARYDYKVYAGKIFWEFDKTDYFFYRFSG